jgi:hypothetical protein
VHGSPIQAQHLHNGYGFAGNNIGNIFPSRQTEAAVSSQEDSIPNMVTNDGFNGEQRYRE